VIFARTNEDSPASAAPGTDAWAPARIPARGWWQIARRATGAVYAQNLVVTGAGLAFLTLLSLFPMLMAIVSIYGLVADPTIVEQQIAHVARLLPADARHLLEQQLRDIVTASPSRLGLGVAASILGSLWAASKAVTYFFMSLNVAYGERESRNFIKLKGTALLFTLGFVAFVVFSLGLVALLPVLAGIVGLGDMTETLLRLGRWPVLGAAIMLGLATIYRYGPNRREPKWRWVSPGAVFATGAWLLLSALFSLYVSSFGKFNEVYGSLGTGIVLMLWLFLTCFLILLGAQINAQAGLQTTRDSTVAPDQAMGERGAYVADTPPPATAGGRRAPAGA
jgi:membrane protein